MRKKNYPDIEFVNTFGLGFIKLTRIGFQLDPTLLLTCRPCKAVPGLPLPVWSLACDTSEKVGISVVTPGGCGGGYGWGDVGGEHFRGGCKKP